MGEATAEWHLAQLNIALPVAPLDTPRLAEFVAALDHVNALADAAPGFVWRLQTDEGHATGVRAFGDDRLIVNMSVWESGEALFDFVYRSEHVDYVRRRREWFTPFGRQFAVLWWVPAGHVPTVAEAEERLASLQRHGPTDYAFDMRRVFPPPAAEVAVNDDRYSAS